MAMDQETARLILSGDLSDISLFDIKEAVAAADDAALESKVNAYLDSLRQEAYKLEITDAVELANGLRDYTALNARERSDAENAVSARIAEIVNASNDRIWDIDEFNVVGLATVIAADRNGTPLQAGAERDVAHLVDAKINAHAEKLASGQEINNTIYEKSLNYLLTQTPHCSEETKRNLRQIMEKTAGVDNVPGGLMVRNERALSFTDNNFELFERDENGKETDKVSAQFKNLENIISRMTITQMGEKEVETLDAEEKRAAVNALFRASVLRASKATMIDPQFLFENKTTIAQRKKFIENVEFEFTKSLLISKVGENMVELTAGDFEKDAAGRYALRDTAIDGRLVPQMSADIKDAASLLYGKGDILVDKDFLSADSAAAQFEYEQHKGILKAKLGNLYLGLRNYKKAYEKVRETAKRAFGKDNLYRLLNNNGMSMLISTGVTVGSLAALTASAPATGTAIAAAAVYAGWNFANASVSPVIDQLREQRRQHEKEIGKKLGFAARLKYSYGNVKKIKAAFKAVKEKDLNYKTKVGTTLIVGALGGTVMGGAGSILARYAMSPAISGTVAVFAHRRVKASKKDLIKNRSVAAYQRYKSAKQARTSANVSVAVSGASAVFFGAQAAHNHAEVIGAVAKLDNTADWNNILTQAQTSSLSAKLAHELGMSKPWYNPAGWFNRSYDFSSVDSEKLQAALGKVVKASEAAYPADLKNALQAVEAARAGTESPVAAETILNGKEERISALNAQEYAAARSGAAPENLYNQINGENFSMTTYQTTIRESFFTTRNGNTGYDDLNVNGVKVRTAKELMTLLEASSNENHLEGKPSGMTAADYLYHRNMLKEYIGIRDNQDLSNELNRAGVTQEQWNELIKNGTGDKALVDKLFATKLGGHAARLLIDLDIECKEVNDVQKAVIHRGLATINMDPNDAHSGGKIGYYKGADSIAFADNTYTGAGVHRHQSIDCDGELTTVYHNGGGKAKVEEVVEVKEEPVKEPPQPVQPVVEEKPEELEYSVADNGAKPMHKAYYFLPGEYGKEVAEVGQFNADGTANVDGASASTIWVKPNAKDPDKLDVYSLLDGQAVKTETISKRNISYVNGLVAKNIDDDGNVASKKATLILSPYEPGYGDIGSTKVTVSKLPEGMVDRFEEAGLVDRKNAEVNTSNPIVQNMLMTNDGKLPAASPEDVAAAGERLGLSRGKLMSKFENGVTNYRMLTDEGVVHAVESKGEDGKLHVKVTVHDLNDRPSANISRESREKAFQQMKESINSHKKALMQSQQKTKQ